MTDQTPHLTMDIIASRAADDLARTEETVEQHYLGAPVPDYRAAVDAVIAARDLEVAANAIRRLARNLDTAMLFMNIEEEQALSDAMLDHADRIEAGDE